MVNRAPTAILPYILSELHESEESLRAQDIDVQELIAIYNDYINRLDELEGIAELLANTLMRQKDVHAVRHRVKDPLHLLKKIIRKKKEYPDRNLTTNNYLGFINDLIGVRILHLYKDAWHDIGNYIQQVWELKREPYAYVKREHTLQTVQFAASKYRVFVNPRGYKAEHYIIKTRPNKQQYLAEIQVKTLFEEGWSEVDHCIRYPDHKPNELLNRLLWLLSQLTANADDISTQIRALAIELQKYKPHLPQPSEVTNAQLRSHINNLPVDEQEKQYLYNCLAKITAP
jgi:putative GTP pyrophosphokinase